MAVNGTTPKDPGYKIVNSANAADVYVYAPIGDWFGMVSAEQFVSEVKDLQVANIVLHLNSPGGDVFDGVAMYNTLKSHPANVEVRIEGLAASAASFLAMAGDTVKIGRNAQLMIHKAWGIEIGNSDDMLKYAEILEKIDGTIADTYYRRAGGSVEAWAEAMAVETWYTGPEAVAAGLADSLLDSDAEDEPEDIDAALAALFEQHTKSLAYAYHGRKEAPAPYIPVKAPTNVTALAGTPTTPTGEAESTWQVARSVAVAAVIGR